jgi:hypothetical protein
VAHAERARRRDARELEVQPLGIGERALRADQQVRRVGVRRAEVVEVVPGHLAQQLRKARFDLVLLARVQGLQLFDESGIAGVGRDLAHGSKPPALALRGDRLDGEHVVHHVAVGDGARAAGIVARHAAERGLRAGGHVDREPQALRPQARIERVEHHAGLHDRPVALHLQHLVEVLGVVDDQRLADRLAALRAAGAARQDRYSFVRRDGDSGARRLLAARHDHADRLQLVDRRVGRVAAAACCIEQNLGVGLLGQTRGEGRSGAFGQSNRERRRVHRAK